MKTTNSRHELPTIRRRYVPLLIALFLFSTGNRQANSAVDFTFQFTDANGVGFNHNSLGAARRAALDKAVGIVESLFVNYNATIVLDVAGDETEDSTLASAGSEYSSEYPGTGFVDRGDVMLKILGGNSMDPDPNAADGFITWNFQDTDWEFGDDFQTDEYDFISTAAHELLHTVGFLSGIRRDGTDYWSTPSNEPGTWEPFDQFVAGPSGSVVHQSTFVINSSVWNSARTGGSNNGLFFNGPEAMKRNGGDPVNLYSPSRWETGSSGSHLDDEEYNGIFLMEAATGDGLGIRSVSNIERAILQDIGYSLISYGSGLFADLDGNGSVDSTDLGRLLNNFGDTSGLDYNAGNLNDDANVDSSDLGLLLNVFGSTSAITAATVPEPNGVWWSLGLAFILWRRISSASFRG